MIFRFVGDPTDSGRKKPERNDRAARDPVDEP
jgi:hypothetical protein